MGRVLTFKSWESSKLEESSNVEVVDPVTPSEVVPDSVTPTTVETNKEILGRLKVSGILGEDFKDLPVPENKLFLPSLLTVLNDKKIKPVLFIPQINQPMNLPKQIQLSIPDHNLSFDLKKGYFGTDVLLPKGIHLKLGYQGSGAVNPKIPILPRVEPVNPSNLRFAVQIPIGTR